MTTPAPRSTFVTVVAAVFMTFSGFGALVGILQNLMLHLLFPLEQFRSQSQAAGEQLPATAAFVFQYFPWWFALFLVANLLMFTASTGLLLRRNWGRRLFIGLHAIAIVWQIVGCLLQRRFISEMMRIPDLAQSPPEIVAQMNSMMTVMQVFSIMSALAFIALSAWLIWKFRTPAIMAEFAARARG